MRCFTPARQASIAAKHSSMSIRFSVPRRAVCLLTPPDPMYVDRTYYLAPGDGPAAQSYAVLHAGMQGKVGIGKLAIYGREYLVAVRSHMRGLVMHTLHHAAEIRSIDAIDELQAVPVSV